MKTQILLATILTLSLASALSVSPDAISIDGFPGEIFTHNITLSSDTNVSVELNSSSEYITINHTKPLYVYGAITIPVQFIVSSDAPIGAIDLTVTPATTSHSSGSSSKQEYGGKIKPKINKSLNETTISPINETEVLPNDYPAPVPEEKKNWKTVVGILGSIIAIIIGIALYVRRSEKLNVAEERKEGGKNEYQSNSESSQ